VPQLQSRVLFETVPARALARPPEDVSEPPHGHAVPVDRGRGQNERPVRRAAVDDRPTRLPDAWPGRGQVPFLWRRAGRQVRPEWRRRAVRSGVRQVRGYRPGARRAGTAVHGLRPGHAVRAARIGVRAERGARPGPGAMGTARGIQVRRAALGQESEGDRSRRRRRTG